MSISSVTNSTINFGLRRQELVSFRDITQRLAQLTNEERECVQLIVAGGTIDKISDRMQSNRQTAGLLVARVLHKLRVPTAAALVDMVSNLHMQVANQSQTGNRMRTVACLIQSVWQGQTDELELNPIWMC